MASSPPKEVDLTKNGRGGWGERKKGGEGREGEKDGRSEKREGREGLELNTLKTMPHDAESPPLLSTPPFPYFHLGVRVCPAKRHDPTHPANGRPSAGRYGAYGALKQTSPPLGPKRPQSLHAVPFPRF